jgi:beta-lactamase class A
MVDLYSGKGVAYNADKAFYSASTIKGPYVASIAASQPNSVQNYGSTMRTTIDQSSNSGYASLRNAFGSAPMVAWCQRAGVSTSLAYNSYLYYSARDLAKLWAQNYGFFFGNYQNNAEVRSWFTSPLQSALYYALGSTYTTYSKPGWMYGQPLACNDAGIVWAGDRPYIIAILTNAYGSRVNQVQSLVWALENAHREMLP